MRWVLPFLALLVTSTVAAQTLDDRVREVASRLMCPVCAGRTVAESPSELAAQMRDLIRRKLQQGESPEEIIAYFVDRYGEGVLAEPPRHGLGTLLWVAPLLLIAGGAAFVVLRFGRGTGTTEPPDGDEELDADPL